MAVTHFNEVPCGQVAKKNPLLTTSDKTEVTCKKCLKALEKMEHMDVPVDVETEFNNPDPEPKVDEPEVELDDEKKEFFNDDGTEWEWESDDEEKCSDVFFDAIDNGDVSWDEDGVESEAVLDDDEEE